MKIYGHTPLPVPSIVVPFQRFDSNGNAVALAVRMTAIQDYQAFDDLVPQPKPRFKHTPGKDPEPWFDDPELKTKFQDYMQLKTAWGFMQAFRDNDGWEWETVDPLKPDTWKNVENELKDWLLPAEIMQLAQKWTELSGISSQRINELRDSFLSGDLKAIQFQPPSLTGELSSTQSTEPVSVQISDSPEPPTPGTPAQ